MFNIKPYKIQLWGKELRKNNFGGSIMKMLKKAAAVLLAAAMSLVMLTACGGGSGSTTKLAKILSESQKTGLYMDVALGGKQIKSAFKDGKQVICKDGSGTWYMKADNTIYYQNGIARGWTKGGSVVANPVKHYVDQLSSVVPSQSSLSKIKVNPKYKAEGLEGTYYAEIVTSEGGQEVAYCFQGDAVKYMVIEKADGQTNVVTVNKFSAELPDAVAPLFDLPINNG